MFEIYIIHFNKLNNLLYEYVVLNLGLMLALLSGNKLKINGSAREQEKFIYSKVECVHLQT